MFRFVFVLVLVHVLFCSTALAQLEKEAITLEVVQCEADPNTSTIEEALEAALADLPFGTIFNSICANISGFKYGICRQLYPSRGCFRENIACRLAVESLLNGLCQIPTQIKESIH